MDLNASMGGNDSLWDQNSTDSAGHTGSTSSFPYSLIFITVPGIVTNSLAMFFIIRDMKKAIFPAIILIAALCTTNLIAVIFSAIRHIVSRYISHISYSMCASLSVPHTFFRVYSGVLNAMMALDRVLAICYPFYYKTNIDVITWKIGIFIAAFSTFCFSMFPIIGLGDVMTTVTRSSGTIVYYCSTFGYRSEPIEKVYGFLFAIAGFSVVITIVLGNVLVIRSILHLNNRIVSMGPSSASSTETLESGALSSHNVTTFEIAFAKLMGCLATVYLLCEVPYNILVLLQQVNISVDPSVKGLIHFMGGLSYSCDPIVYILIRKVKVKRIINFLCRCRKENVDIIRERNVETRPA